MRVTLFHNPSAGDARLTADQLQSILREAGYQVRYQSTEKDWRSALDDVGELAVVAGGDGTVAKVAIELADTGVPLAVLPVGTANNLGKALGVFGDAREIVAGWADAPTVAVDVGVVIGPFGERRFLESVGGGVFVELIRRGRSEVDEASSIVHRETDRALQLLADILTDAPIAEWQIQLDDYDLSGQYIGVEAMNIGFAGPNVPLATEADISDGKLDLVLLRGEDRKRLLDYVVGRVESASALMPSLDVRRGQHVRIAPPPDWGFRIDDELADLGGDEGRAPRTGPSPALDILVRPSVVQVVAGRTGSDRR